jgi:VanZ family protein
MEVRMKLKYVSWLPAVILMGIIFYFSSKPDYSSNQSSLFIVNVLLKIYEKITHIRQQEIKPEMIETLNFIERKLSHFCEYAVLADAFAFHLAVLKQKGKRLFLFPVILSAIYASTDEFHQLFVPGRSGQLRDVMIDTSGAIAGTLVFILITARIIHKRGKQNKPVTLQQ